MGIGNIGNKGGGHRLASLVTNVAIGASKGGVYGAAAGAAKTLLPGILKTVIGIIAALILLPTLVIAALPSMMFGFDSASDGDVAEMTAKARNVGAAYGNVKDYNQDEIDKIVRKTKSSYGDDEYDEVEVDSSINGTNMYWFIAITSVAHKQNLFAMDEGSVRDMAARKITSSSEIVVTENEDGDETKTLRITIRDMAPDTLMDDLGFTDAEREWAKAIYSTIADDQILSDEHGGYAHHGANYGDIKFTGAATQVTYYNQADSRWAGIPYDGGGYYIRNAGCGPTALAIVVASLKDGSVTPADVARWAMDSGFCVTGHGTVHDMMPTGGEHYGLDVDCIGIDAARLAQALGEGKLVIALMAKGHFTKGGHFIVLRGITENGDVLVADPGSLSRSNQEWPLRLIINEARRGSGGNGPFWVYSP